MPELVAEHRPTAVPIVDAVAKALEILDCFSAHQTELSLNQLCDKTGLYKSRVHRLCGTLISSGYLVRTSRTNYRLGPKLMVLGKVYEKSNTLRSIAAPLMRKLTEQTGESTALFVVDGMNCICMTREMGISRLVYAINEGDHMELRPTASGRVLLAYAEPEFVAKVLSQSPGVRHTDKTRVDRKDIEETLVLIRERGYDINIEELEQGISALAAPIFDFDNKVPAALAIVGPAHRFAGENQERMLQQLLTTSREISRLMGEA